jgi:hypothetical protein
MTGEVCIIPSDDEDAATRDRLLTDIPNKRENRQDQITPCCQLDHPKNWRWLVVAAVFVTSFIFAMIERTMSLYYVEMIDYFEADSSVMSLIGSVFYCFFCFTGKSLFRIKFQSTHINLTVQL